MRGEGEDEVHVSSHTCESLGGKYIRTAADQLLDMHVLDVSHIQPSLPVRLRESHPRMSLTRHPSAGLHSYKYMPHCCAGICCKAVAHPIY